MLADSRRFAAVPWHLTTVALGPFSSSQFNPAAPLLLLLLLQKKTKPCRLRGQE